MCQSQRSTPLRIHSIFLLSPPFNIRILEFIAHFVFDPMWNNVQVKCGSSQWKTLLLLYKWMKKLTTLLRRCNNAIHDLRVNDMAKGQMRLPKTILLLEHQLLYGNLILLKVQVLQKMNKPQKINCNKKLISNSISMGEV